MENLTITKEATTFKGKISFISLFHPIIIEINGVKNNILQLFLNVFSQLSDKPVTMKEDKSNFEFFEDQKSEYFLRYNNDKSGILMWAEKKESIGGFNMGAYLPDALQRLNGRNIIVEFSRNRFKISADPEENVFGVWYSGQGNDCKVEDADVKRICKPGTNDCCIFLAAGGNGFECLKHNTYMSRQLLYRYAEGKMNATRIGNCEILGRKD